MRLCPGNPVSAALNDQIRMIKKNVTGEQITNGGSFATGQSYLRSTTDYAADILGLANNRSGRMAIEATHVAADTAGGYDRTDVTLANMADEPYLGGGLGGGLGPLPPIGNASFPRATEFWLRFLRDTQGLSPSDFGVSSWDQVMPSGMPTGALPNHKPSLGAFVAGCSRSLRGVVCVRAGDDPSRAERARYYWTLRFMGEIVVLSRDCRAFFLSR